MNSETPFSGDMPDGSDDAPYEWLDEWLCEYVDGTMDPSLEAIFEQYVEANPELEAHVERLKETRRLLCECSLPRPSLPEGTDDRCTEEGEDASSAPISTLLSDRPAAALGLVSSVAVALVVGFLVGATVGPPPSPLSTSASSPSSSARAPAPPPLETTHDPASISTVPLPQLSPSPTDSIQPPSSLTTVGQP
ncbi:MAG: hypothetical protein BRD55_01990 [Bacteroidetes bacterium SW_9_63_38]|nr:MAG: hypothetical protein BRD55_01990 [Bacteroidetes bacterium SW_9_63_38]